MRLAVRMVITTLFWATAIHSVAGAGQSQANGNPTVLLELFTSEGCSSCPPADKLLMQLDSRRSLDGADLVVLSEHVDYWNHDGWVDPYSSHELTKRQEDYASLLGSEVYTPQVVIDGRKQVSGNDQAALDHAIRDSVKAPKAPIALVAKREAGQLALHLNIPPIAGKGAAVYLVLATDQARSHVTRGENAGRDLEHVAVVRILTKIGAVRGDSGFEKDLRSALPPALQTGSLRVAVFVQDHASKRILGVAEERL